MTQSPLRLQLARTYAGQGIAQIGAMSASTGMFFNRLDEDPMWLAILWGLLAVSWVVVACWSFQSARRHKAIARAMFPPIPNRNHETEGFDK